MSRTKGKSDTQRIRNDRYETPQWCINAMVSRLVFGIGKRWPRGDGLTVIDIGAGDGRIGKSVRAALPCANAVFIDIASSVEITDPGRETMIVEDFIQTDLAQFTGPRLFISNPPFSVIDKIIMKAVEASYQSTEPTFAVFLTRLDWLGSERRSKWMNMYSPRKVTVLAPRPSFCVRETVEDGVVYKSSNDSGEYGWIWWGKSLKQVGLEVAVWPASKAERKLENLRSRGKLA